jgi:hypothetical protein
MRHPTRAPPATTEDHHPNVHFGPSPPMIPTTNSAVGRFRPPNAGLQRRSGPPAAGHYRSSPPAAEHAHCRCRSPAAGPLPVRPASRRPLPVLVIGRRTSAAEHRTPPNTPTAGADHRPAAGPGCRTPNTGPDRSRPPGAVRRSVPLAAEHTRRRPARRTPASNAGSDRRRLPVPVIGRRTPNTDTPPVIDHRVPTTGPSTGGRPTTGPVRRPPVTTGPDYSPPTTGRRNQSPNNRSRPPVPPTGR